MCNVHLDLDGVSINNMTTFYYYLYHTFMFVNLSYTMPIK